MLTCGDFFVIRYDCIVFTFSAFGSWIGPSVLNLLAIVFVGLRVGLAVLGEGKGLTAVVSGVLRITRRASEAGGVGRVIMPQTPQNIQTVNERIRTKFPIGKKWNNTGCKLTQ